MTASAAAALYNPAMRLIATADLHYNHPRSRGLAEEVIARINAAGGDVLLVIGDTAVADGDSLERCLGLFHFSGPKLFVAGNHELWTRRPDSHEIYSNELPARVRALGWRWLEGEPFVAGDVGIVGSIGWYDYSFSQSGLGIPSRFYERKVSPGAAERFEEFADLLEKTHDVLPLAREIVARWNDGRHVRLHRSDNAFLDELLNRLASQLSAMNAKRIIAAIHHLPFRELLPPSHNSQWDFAKAYLGSERIGEVLSRDPRVDRVLCGHSHFPIEATVGKIRAVNIGSGYRWKTFKVLDLD